MQPMRISPYLLSGACRNLTPKREPLRGTWGPHQKGENLIPNIVASPMNRLLTTTGMKIGTALTGKTGASHFETVRTKAVELRTTTGVEEVRAVSEATIEARIISEGAEEAEVAEGAINRLGNNKVAQMLPITPPIRTRVNQANIKSEILPVGGRLTFFRDQWTFCRWSHSIISKGLGWQWRKKP